MLGASDMFEALLLQVSRHVLGYMHICEPKLKHSAYNASYRAPQVEAGYPFRGGRYGRVSLWLSRTDLRQATNPRSYAYEFLVIDYTLE